MSDQDRAGGSLIVTTSDGNYYVIPAAALAQFRATAEQQQMIDEPAPGCVGEQRTPSTARRGVRTPQVRTPLSSLC
ncbi:MAG: hypothetical protein M3Z04_02275 [Chloroflexota bacterium]|nr:hypothetical protein [Chloroflexota bacterium]